MKATVTPTVDVKGTVTVIKEERHLPQSVFCFPQLPCSMDRALILPSVDVAEQRCAAFFKSALRFHSDSLLDMHKLLMDTLLSETQQFTDECTSTLRNIKEGVDRVRFSAVDRCSAACRVVSSSSDRVVWLLSEVEDSQRRLLVNDLNSKIERSGELLWRRLANLTLMEASSRAEKIVALESTEWKDKMCLNHRVIANHAGDVQARFRHHVAAFEGRRMVFPLENDAGGSVPFSDLNKQRPGFRAPPRR